MEGDNIFRYRNMDIKLGGREMATVVYSNEVFIGDRWRRIC